MVLALGLGVGLLVSGQAQSTNLYPKDLAVTLMSEGDVEKETAVDGFKKVEDTAEPSLLGPPVVPLGDVPVADNQGRLVPAPKQWEVPPFPSLDPALPKDLPPQIREQMQRDKGPGPAPAPVFGEVAPYDYQVSAELRPRAQRPNDMLRVTGGEAPLPFSARRYTTEAVGFVQVAVYGGTTSIKAEQIYQTLRAAALNREDIQGVGREGFLTRIAAPKEEKPVAAASPEPEPSASPAAPSRGGFDAIDVTGPARPDMLDPGMAESASAPSFRGVPTRLDPAAAPKPTSGTPAPAPANDSASDDLAVDEATAASSGVTSGTSPLMRSNIDGPSMLVLVAYFPDRAAVLEVAVDERIANMQQLLNLALKAQTRLGEVWSEQTQR